MSDVAVRRTGLACVALVAVVMFVVLARVTASAPPPSAVLEACVNPGNGNLRLVADGVACHNNETRVSWNVDGPAGPAGPAGPTGAVGPTGPAGADGASAGGPPFVWVCTPGNFDFVNNGNAEVDIFNGSDTTATLSTHFLAKNGANLAGGVIPSTNPVATYPGETGNNTVTVASKNTLILPFLLGGGTRASDNTMMATVMVTSDQPIVVGMQMANGPLNAVPCNQLPK
jgi:hypothetical protein